MGLVIGMPITVFAPRAAAASFPPTGVKVNQRPTCAWGVGLDIDASNFGYTTAPRARGR